MHLPSDSWQQLLARVGGAARMKVENHFMGEFISDLFNIYEAYFHFHRFSDIFIFEYLNI